MSSLEAMQIGVERALNTEKARGILDLDAPWTPPSHAEGDNNEDGGSEPVPFVAFSHTTETSWIKTARVVLSPWARVTGWKVQFENRSIAHALLTHARENPILCASKMVRVEEWVDSNNGEEEGLGGDDYPQISDATIRVENCPDTASPLTLLNLFSRFDLRMDGGPAVVQWSCRTSDGKVPPTTWLVHFADASWARAALREKQGATIEGRPVTLAQYPKHLL